ncbi:unnamed protein product [Fusarium fujikuroi]|nr:unnamed protein product [Fusarium fujikuroi]
MNSYHASRLARLLASSQDESPQDQSSQDQSPQEPSVTDLMSNAYHQALLLGHRLPALHSDPPSHHWRSMRSNQIQGPITFRISTQNAMRELSELRRSFRVKCLLPIHGPLYSVPGTVSRACHRFAYTIELGTSDRVPFQILRRPVDGDRI